LSSTRKNESVEGTPSLINVKKLDSAKRNRGDLENSSEHLFKSKLQSQTSEESVTANSPTITSKVSSKPPLNKRVNKAPYQKACMQGWLYRKKHPKFSNSTNNLNNLGLSSPSPSSSHLKTSLIRHHLNSKWKRYWCVLGKDYIVFYKNQDDKMLDSFLLLRDFLLLRSGRENGFLLIEKQKQLEHEFYAETSEEFKDWYQVLNDLHTRSSNSEQLSLSSTSLSSASALDSLLSGADGAMSILPTTSSSSSLPMSQSLPSSTSLSRKNNLHLNLSTIIDNNDDNTGNHSPQLSSNASPTLINTLQYQQSFNSSRESSPGGLQMKQHSRDGSPSLIYRI
jgi:hypothetical protein